MVPVIFKKLVTFVIADTMSSNIQHHTSHSRSSSIDDHQSTENDISIYATPKPDTPFVTPTSTPRLLHCRLNPVTTIRQHVPLKINFTQQSPGSTSEQGKMIIMITYAGTLVISISYTYCPSNTLIFAIFRIFLPVGRVLIDICMLLRMYARVYNLALNEKN